LFLRLIFINVTFHTSPILQSLHGFVIAEITSALDVIHA